MLPTLLPSVLNLMLLLLRASASPQRRRTTFGRYQLPLASAGNAFLLLNSVLWLAGVLLLAGSPAQLSSQHRSLWVVAAGTVTTLVLALVVSRGSVPVLCRAMPPAYPTGRWPVRAGRGKTTPTPTVTSPVTVGVVRRG